MAYKGELSDVELIAIKLEVMRRTRAQLAADILLRGENQEKRLKEKMELKKKKKAAWAKSQKMWRG